GRGQRPVPGDREGQRGGVVGGLDAPGERAGEGAVGAPVDGAPEVVERDGRDAPARGVALDADVDVLEIDGDRGRGTVVVAAGRARGRARHAEEGAVAD